MSMNNVSKRRLSWQERGFGEERCTDSMRSPFRTIVSGFATWPFIVVTPDSSAYLWFNA